MNHLEGRLIGVLNSEVRLIISPKPMLVALAHPGQRTGWSLIKHDRTFTYRTKNICLLVGGVCVPALPFFARCFFLQVHSKRGKKKQGARMKVPLTCSI